MKSEIVAQIKENRLVAIIRGFPSEAVASWEAGADFVKIFPAGSLGPGYVKAIAAPLSHIPFLAVGGISSENAADFLRAGFGVNIALAAALVFSLAVSIAGFNALRATVSSVL